MDKTNPATTTTGKELFTRENAIAIGKQLPRKGKVKIAESTGHNKGTVSAVLNGNVKDYQSDTSRNIIKAAIKLLNKTEKELAKELEELREIIG